MSKVRFGVSLDEEVLNTLDNFVVEHQFPNRSQAIRHLIESNSIENNWNKNKLVSGAIILLFDHHKSDIGVKMTHIQHHFFEEILSSQHFHLDHDNCLEIIAVKGKAERLTDLAKQLISLKGIIHGKLVTSKLI
ncbi:nickel-responsive transcriptional regulator NikR [Bergeyella porcorum]|uniref:nickel-responsive transcriptional regulator NikR n=1 Tax=Bergeyella porcorum TaxID=1735111 RepID=UPI0035E8E82E